MDRITWDQRLARYQRLRLLVEADEEYGPLGYAMAAVQVAEATMRKPSTPEQDHRYGKLRDEEEVAFFAHMAAYFNPLIEAAVELIETPAPDIAAAKLKLEIVKDISLDTYLDHQPFHYINEDVSRLMAEEAE